MATHLCSFHYRGSHYRNFWLMYAQVGDFCINRRPPIVPLTKISHNAVFSSPKIHVRDPLYPSLPLQITQSMNHYTELAKCALKAKLGSLTWHWLIYNGFGLWDPIKPLCPTSTIKASHDSKHLYRRAWKLITFRHFWVPNICS